MSKADDIVSRHLAVAEATGDVLPSKRRRSLANYVRATKHLDLDPWQVDLCNRLEKAFWLAQAAKFEFEQVYVDEEFWYESPSGFLIEKEEFEKKKSLGTLAAIHAGPQFGKSILISQCYPAWILGWDPIHRFRLATYNERHSVRFSIVIKYLIRSPEHLQFFPDEAGHLVSGKTREREWWTNARKHLNDGQSTFTALGLQSGFVGHGADSLICDDPYKGAEEAMSEIIRDKTWRFWTDTAAPRMNDQSNIFIMFHRYHQDDMGGRAIASGEFDLIRYAAQADGAYEDEDSGRSFPDPIGRPDGEYLSPRFSEAYYARHRKNEDLWYSQFQGRPSAKTGKMFNVTLMSPIAHKDLPPILFFVRAWDNAATAGGGAFTAGVKMGIDASENVYIFDMKRQQVDTAERQMLQQATAETDGKMVEIHAPEDPGSAGKDVAFEFQQVFSRQGYKVTVKKAGTTDDVAGGQAYGRSKVMRAYTFSKAVNMGKVFLVLNRDGKTPDWHKKYKTELQYFPASTFKDQVDCSADGYNHLIRLFYRGLVIKSASQVNLLHRSLFESRFGEKIAAHWDVQMAIRVAEDSSRPSGYAIIARAAENAFLGDVVFIVAAARMYVDNPVHILIEAEKALRKHCAKGTEHPSVIWISGAVALIQVAAQKMNFSVTEFIDDDTAGIPETNYYFQRVEKPSPFYPNRPGAAHCYVLVADKQYDEADAVDEDGMLSLRQDLASWTYTDKGEVQPFAGITLDCVRKTLYKFALSATSLTDDERRIAQLPKELQGPSIAAKRGTQEFVELLLAREHALSTMRINEYDQGIKDARNARLNGETFGKVPVLHRFRRATIR